MSGFSSSQTVSHNQRVSYLLTWAVEICWKKSVVHPHGHMGTWPQDQVPDPQAPGSRFWGLQRSFRNGDPFFRIRNSRNGHFSVRIWKRFSTFLGFSNFFERQSVSKIYRSSHVFPPGPVGISERKGKPKTTRFWPTCRRSGQEKPWWFHTLQKLSSIEIAHGSTDFLRPVLELEPSWTIQEYWMFFGPLN